MIAQAVTGTPGHVNTMAAAVARTCAMAIAAWAWACALHPAGTAGFRYRSFGSSAQQLQPGRGVPGANIGHLCVGDDPAVFLNHTLSDGAVLARADANGWSETYVAVLVDSGRPLDELEASACSRLAPLEPPLTPRHPGDGCT